MVMDCEKDLQYWLEFVSRNEEKETNLEEITFYDFREIFRTYFNSLSGELERLITSLKFPFEVKNIELEIEKEDKDKYYIKINYYTNEKDYTIDSYGIDILGVYYSGYHLTKQQAQVFYQENYDFFQKIIPVYYLDYLFYSENLSFSHSYDDYNTGTKLTFSRSNNPSFSIWRKVTDNTYNYDSTIFSRDYLNHPEFLELYDSVLKRISIPISSIDGKLKYLIELAKIDNILINDSSKIKKK